MGVLLPGPAPLYPPPTRLHPPPAPHSDDLLSLYRSVHRRDYRRWRDHCRRGDMMRRSRSLAPQRQVPPPRNGQPEWGKGKLASPFCCPTPCSRSTTYGQQPCKPGERGRCAESRSPKRVDSVCAPRTGARATRGTGRPRSSARALSARSPRHADMCMTCTCACACCERASKGMSNMCVLAVWL